MYIGAFRCSVQYTYISVKCVHLSLTQQCEVRLYIFITVIRKCEFELTVLQRHQNCIKIDKKICK
jgi:hypothetical protein